ncbi:flagellar biosynthetic protein FliO [Vibrio sp. SM6]|uniref:Flagellar protein n=1 Tax=Vibrio agarilyticus TaxID=2726741 RepID=A0A7X8TR06_9VIBR|nr:flagellar biosynthetic protein FliO [Vibrio agarilyticus]NLS13236.1 flagellar biosynthetic protein FliO [Vibrio agarilyticus]
MTLWRCTLMLALLWFSRKSFAATPSAPDLDLATTFGSLVLVIAFIVLLAWLVKRMQGQTMGRTQGLKIVSQLAVGTKERIAIVEVGEAQYLVGITAHTIQLLSKLDSPIAESEVTVAPFAKQLSELMKRKDGE